MESRAGKGPVKKRILGDSWLIGIPSALLQYKRVAPSKSDALSQCRAGSFPVDADTHCMVPHLWLFERQTLDISTWCKPHIPDLKDMARDMRWHNSDIAYEVLNTRLFITYHGSIGLAARPGDQIVYSGGRYLFIFRSRDDGAVNLVGDCYVQRVITLLSTNIDMLGCWLSTQNCYMLFFYRCTHSSAVGSYLP
ncbi:hypothetical protein BDV27DRAFT_120555 [Aspergillus caelatus]|uniref:Uncharacterized protein n=1 Tax=Aspergillus caelatus TaxID=61420 RepID=A0A5N7AI95_9EURO|nr:uncharacterized protein BDV27DRAFT_120555 [Aspergillus caelatus]KAE8369594.1 hypothetical protein BDV27DRAFT_120555 [Aspergillus caelatus]